MALSPEGAGSWGALGRVVGSLFWDPYFAGWAFFREQPVTISFSPTVRHEATAACKETLQAVGAQGAWGVAVPSPQPTSL